MVLWVISPYLFSVVFGVDWHQSGVYVQFLIPWVLAVFIFVPMMQLYITLEQQKTEFRFQLLILLSRVSGIVIGGMNENILLALALYSIFSLISYAVCGAWIIHKAGVKLQQIVLFSFREVFIALSVVLLAFAVSRIYLSDLGLFQLLVSLVLLGGFLYRAKSDIVNMKAFK